VYSLWLGYWYGICPSYGTTIEVLVPVASTGKYQYYVVNLTASHMTVSIAPIRLVFIRKPMSHLITIWLQLRLRNVC
jgi:hypothetical protein